jgi:hypothetical protein
MAIIKVEYNQQNTGPKIITWNDKPLLVYIYNRIKGKRVLVACHTLPPNHYFQFNRQWFTNWEIEVFEWNDGELIKAHVNVFNPYNQVTHFHLAEFDPIEDHIEYAKACLEYASKWKLENFVIESPWAIDLEKEFPGVRFAHKIMDPNNCYVSYEIKKTLSEYGAYENFGVYTLSEEIVNFNNTHPVPSDTITSYELAKSILFGPNYDESYKFIPPTWTLTNK